MLDFPLWKRLWLWGVTLFFALASLAPVRWKALRWLIALMAAPVALFDNLENFAVAGLIELGATGLTPDAVQIASQWTSLKSGATTVAMSLLLAFAVIRVVRFGYRRWRRPVRVAQ